MRTFSEDCYLEQIGRRINRAGLCPKSSPFPDIVHMNTEDFIYLRILHASTLYQECSSVGTSLFGGVGLFGLPILAAILTNLNDDPEVPIRLYRKPGEEEPSAPEEPGKIVYRFVGSRQERRKRGGDRKDKKDEEKP